MSANKLFLIGALLAAVLMGRQLLPGADVDEDLPPLPVMRAVESDAPDLDWTPDPEVRDPFVPLVLPEAPAPVPDEEPEAGG